MSETVSIRKLADFSPTAMIKSSSQTMKGLLVIIAIGLIGFAVCKAYIKKPDASQSQTIKAEKGAIVNVQQRQENPRKRIIPFIEIGVGQSRNNRLDTFVKGGVRIEF